MDTIGISTGLALGLALNASNENAKEKTINKPLILECTNPNIKKSLNHQYWSGFGDGCLTLFGIIALMFLFNIIFD